MNLNEFSELKVGDKVQNLMNAGSPPGEVTKRDGRGVYVRWSKSTTEYFYSVQTTAWMHWNKVQPEDKGAAS